MNEGVVRDDPRALIRRYAILAYGCFGTMFDLGLMVIGSLLVGLSVSLLLAGFDLVSVVLELSTGALLASSLVLAVVGLFFLGVASEGPLGRGRRLVGFNLWEVGIGRVLASLLVGWLALFAHDLVQGPLQGLPEPLHTGASGLRAGGLAGLTAVPLIGVPLGVLVRRYPEAPAWVAETEVPVMFVVWTVATMAFL